MLTVEELSIPRYKVIADYPNGFFKVGEILWSAQDGARFVSENSGHYVEWLRIDMYPHLFKKLEWWENRSAEDMPEYVKPKLNSKKIFKVSGFGPTTTGVLHIGWLDKKRGWLTQAAKALLPATREEYEAYIAVATPTQMA